MQFLHQASLIVVHLVFCVFSFYQSRLASYDCNSDEFVSQVTANSKPKLSPAFNEYMQLYSN